MMNFSQSLIPEAAGGGSTISQETGTSSGLTARDTQLIELFCKTYLSVMLTKGFDFPALRKGLEEAKQKMADVNC